MENEISFPVMDGHVDLLYEMMNSHPDVPFKEIGEGAATLDKLNRGGVRVIVTALYCPDSHNGAGLAWPYLQKLFQYADEHFTGLDHITTPEQLESAFHGDLAPGNVLLLENADALLDRGLEELEKRAVRVVGLTHAGSNRIGDGNNVRNPRGLSRKGRELIKELDEGGYALDVAHLSDPCFWEVMEIFRGPVLSSHTGFRFFCPTPRNLGEEQLKELFEREAVVGVTVSPEMLSADCEAGIEEVFRHIDWVVQKYGPARVGLGSDFCGFHKENSDLKDISSLSRLTDIFTVHGYPSDAIGRIMGGNWRELYRAIL